MVKHRHAELTRITNLGCYAKKSHRNKENIHINVSTKTAAELNELDSQPVDY
jgi:hypothetical protein